jgi:hypothetical protein
MLAVLESLLLLDFVALAAAAVLEPLGLMVRLVRAVMVVMV